MPILLVGLNHRTAPVEVREQLALTDCALQMALQELNVLCEPGSTNGDTEYGLHEGVILSTCNRLEVYARTAGNAESGWTTIEGFLCALQGIDPRDLAPHLYHMQGEAAVEHLMRVASGLDSMILGEPQILGQVGEAMTAAQSAGTSGPILSHLFGHAIHTGKRARSETPISRHTTSVSHAAALLAREKFGDLSSAAVLLVGAGEMAEVAIQALLDHGASDFTYINRTHSRAQAMADQFGGQAINWYHLDEALGQADIVVTATGAPHTVIYANDVALSLPTRGDRPLMFIDIGMPRDVEESVGDLPNVFRYDIDHLKYTVDANMAQRQAAIPDVEAIVREQTTAYMEWYQSRQVIPVLVELRRKAHELADEEIARTIGRLGCDSGKCHETIGLLVHGVLKRLLHEPTVRLKTSAAAGNGYGYAEAIRELFALNAILTESLDEQLDLALTPDD